MTNEPGQTAPDSAKPDIDVDGDRFIHHTALPETRLSRVVDRVLRRIGDAASWVWIALIAVILLNVIMRYAFGQGRIEFEEIQWHLYSVGFLVGLSYAFVNDDHIRVDVLHDRMSLRTQCWVELYGILLLLLPFLLVVAIYAVPFIEYALATGERSQAPGGLPHRFAIKSVLLIGFILLAIAAVSRLTRVCSLLFGAPRALPASDESSQQEE